MPRNTPHLKESHKKAISKSLKGRIFSREHLRSLSNALSEEKSRFWRGDKVGYSGTTYGLERNSENLIIVLIVKKLMPKNIIGLIYQNPIKEIYRIG